MDRSGPSANPATDEPEQQSPPQPITAPANSAHTQNGPASTPHSGLGQRSRKKQKCRFFGTKKGCKAGDSCPFYHDPTLARKTPEDSGNIVDAKSAEAPTPEGVRTAEAPGDSSQRQNVADQSRVVQRPVPTQETKDPRAFQISQVKRRFNAKEDSAAEGTILTFGMPPSDPDFPFDLDELKCTLQVPPGFPTEKPFLRITNSELERGFQINVEKGFDAIWTQALQPTLLNTFKALDKRLEQVLIAKKADTIKLIANTTPTTAVTQPEPSALGTIQNKDVEVQASKTSVDPSVQRREQAQERRNQEVQNLEHRLGKLAQFAKEADGTIYKIPIEPRKRDSLPLSLSGIKAVRLLVPLDYDIEPCSIEVLGVDNSEAQSLEKAFARRAVEKCDQSLLAHINYLAQNMHIMAKEPAVVQPAAPTPKVETLNVDAQKRDQPLAAVSDKSHIQYIARPPEWSTPRGEDEEDDGDFSSDESSYSETEEESDEAEREENTEQKSNTAPREQGIMLSFPSLELYGIELLELVNLNITVKCDRCKDTLDVRNLKDNPDASYRGMRGEYCKKCANQFSLGYRKDLMHTNSIRAGYLDLDGCTPVDMLPSNFTPTCADCSTTQSAPGIISVRGESSLAICRECHRRLTFRIPEVKFLHVGSTALRAAALPRKKKPKENLGIVAGTELPKRGRCTHYSKSHRWFRFSCCQKVFPCDKCHDLESDHPLEFANRMICGYCSREQNYRPEDCGICRATLTGKRGSGFWEGGKGTRDPARMSRKDPRKYKRRGLANNVRSTTKSS